ncbi:MAG: pyridoxal-phosphate dependent enzyme [Cyclobacteriaceae bacterium]
MVKLPSPTQELLHPILVEKQIQLFVKRDDLLHEEIMGNKWRKLKYNLAEAQGQGKKTILTFGGAYSNHIYATAAAGEAFGFKTIGIIRGDELHEDSNDTLQFATSKGMELQFVDRKTYRDYRESPDSLASEYPESYVLPEGGTNKLAIKGCTELVSEIESDFDLIALPIGTGGTFSGVLAGVNESQHVLGISSVQGDFMQKEIIQLLDRFQVKNRNYNVNTAFHFGGYGKTTPQLIDFINWFKAEFSISLDPIYTGKCFFAVWDMINNDKFEKNLKIVLLHTGGLQGILGFNRKNQIIIQ